MNEKSLAINAAFNSIHKVINLIFPIVSSIYVSHILLASGIGRIGIAQNMVQYFVVIAPLGIPNYGTREIAKVRDNLSKTNKLFTELSLINFISTCICLLFYYTSILSVGRFASERLLYIVCGIPIICNLFNIEWFFQGQEEYVYISIRNIIVKLISLVLILVFVRDSSDYNIYALIYACGLGANHVFNVIRLRRFNLKLDFSKLNIRRHLRPITILLCSTIAIELYTLLDTTMLGVMTSEEVVGYYANSIKLNKIVVGLIAAIAGVLLPRLSYYHKNGLQKKCSELVSTITNLMIFLVLPAATGIFLLADNIVPLFFGKSFLPAVLTTRIGVGIVLVLGFSNLFGTQVLLTYDKEKILLLATILGASSNMCMNALLIPRLQQNGAIIASVVSETLVTIITYIAAKKYLTISIDLFACVKSVIGCAIMSGGIILVKQFEYGYLFTTFISIFIGVIIYIGVNIIFKNSNLYFLLDLITKRNQQS